MYKNQRTSLLLLLLLALASCGRQPSVEQTIPEMLAAVPSDALAVLISDKCSEGLQFVDSSSTLRRLPLGNVGKGRMALSLCYNGSTVPVLAIEAPDSVTSELASLSNKAQAMGMQAGFFAPDAASGRKGMFVLTPSEAEMAAVTRHINGSASILDAPRFREALSATGGSKDFAILRNAGAGRFLPQDFLGGIFPRRSLTNFIGTVCEWTVFTPDTQGGSDVQLIDDGSDSWFSSALASSPAAYSKLGAILPDDSSFALALPISSGYRALYEKYLDASVRLTQYHQRIAGLKASSGVDPLNWEKELNIKEIAIVRDSLGTFVLARPSRPARDTGPAANPHKGFMSALYGSAFAVADDSFFCTKGGWYVYGSEEAVGAFKVPAKSEEHKIKWPGNACRIIVYSPARTLCWSKNGIKIWNSSL